MSWKNQAVPLDTDTTETPAWKREAVPIDDAPKVPQQAAGLQTVQAQPEQPVPDYNMGRGALERGGQILGGMFTTADRLADAGDEAYPLGGLTWDDGIIPDYKGPEEYAKWRDEQGGQEPLESASEYWKEADAGYVPNHTWERLKQDFSEGGPLSGSAWAEVMAYGAEQGIKSIPDMGAALFNLPSYVMARSGEIGDERAKNKGKAETELVDIAEAAPFALGSAILERVGAKGIVDAGAEEVGKEALKYGLKRVAAESVKAGGREAATEFVQEGIIEYVGEKFGTDAAMSFAESLDRGAAGAVAGGVYGTGSAAVSSGGREAMRSRRGPYEQAQGQESPTPGPTTTQNWRDEAIAEEFGDTASQSAAPEAEPAPAQQAGPDPITVPDQPAPEPQQMDVPASETPVITTPPDQQQTADDGTPMQQQGITESGTGVFRVPVDQIQVDPEQYQFRSRVNDQGVDRRLSGVDQWDDNRAGTVLLHRREDGSLYVADGHHRVDLARRLGQGEINARVVDEADGVDVPTARVEAAMNNIADGKAEPLDVAKVFRDSGTPAGNVRQAFNLPNNQVVRDGEALANLSDNVFGMVSAGQMNEKDGAAIGAAFTEQSQQEAAADAFTKVQPETDYQRQLLVNEIRAAEFAAAQGEQGGLFGDDPQEVSLMQDRLKVLDSLRQRLNTDRRLFKSLNDNADRAGEAGNQIATEANENITKQSARSLDLIGRVTTTPALNEMVNRAARRVYDGENRPQVVKDLKQELMAYEAGTATESSQRPATAPRRRADEGAGQEQRADQRVPEQDAAGAGQEAQPESGQQEAVESAPDSAFNGDLEQPLVRIFQSDSYNGGSVSLTNVGFTPDEISALEQAGLASNGKMSKSQFNAWLSERSRRLAPKTTKKAPQRDTKKTDPKVAQVSDPDAVEAAWRGLSDKAKKMLNEWAEAANSGLSKLRAAANDLWGDGDKSSESAVVLSEIYDSGAELRRQLGSQADSDGYITLWRGLREGDGEFSWKNSVESFTTRSLVAKNFAGKGGRVVSVRVPVSDVITENGDVESEILVRRPKESNGPAPALDLETQTEEQLAEQERTRQEAEQAETQARREEEQRADADDQVDNFTLTGSDRTADVAMAAGQDDMFVSTPASREVEQAGTQTDTNPTDGQKEAGNYRKGKVRIQGLEIAIENPKGSTRSGTDPDGNRWESTMAHHYGDIKGTEAADGDNLDVFIGPYPEIDQVFVIDQSNADGSFDEHKVMLGFANEADAREGYLANYEDGWTAGPITAMSMDEFKGWVKEGDTTKPLASASPDPEQERANGSDLSLAPSDPKTQGLHGWRKPKGGQGFVYSIQKGGQEVGFLDLSVLDDGTARIMDVVSNEGANSLGPRDVRRMQRQIMEMHPGITQFAGERVSGARRGGDHGFAGSGEEVRVNARRSDKPKEQESKAAKKPVSRSKRNAEKVKQWLGADKGDTIILSDDVGYARAGVEYRLTGIDGDGAWVESSSGRTNISRADVMRAQKGGVAVTKVESTTDQQPRPADTAPSQESDTESGQVDQETEQLAQSTEDQAGDDGNIMFFSRGGERPRNPLPEAQVRRTVEAFFRRYKGANDVNIQYHATAETLPGYNAERDAGAVIAGQYDGRTDTIHLVVSAYDSQSAVREALQEEILVHKGLGFFRPEDRQQLYRDIQQAAQESQEVADLWARTVRDYQGVAESANLNEEQANRYYAEEMLGSLAQENINWLRRGWRTLRQGIKRLLAKAGWVRESIGLDELRSRIDLVARAFERGQRARRRNFVQDIREGVTPDTGDLPQFKRTDGSDLEESRAKFWDGFATQPLDRMFRALFDVTGRVDAHGRLKRGVKITEGTERIIKEWRPNPQGMFRWIDPVLETARHGLLDRYKLTDEYKMEWRKAEAYGRNLDMQAMDILKTLEERGVKGSEAAVLQKILTGEQVERHQLQAVATPILRAIDDLGQAAVEYGVITREQFERNRGAYLHRSYLKHEGEFTGLGKFIHNQQRKQNRKITGDAAKGRGIQIRVPADQVTRHIPVGWYGIKKQGDSPDMQLLSGKKFKVLEDPGVLTDQTETLEGVDTPQPQRSKGVVYWPADRELPARYEAWRNRGTFEVRGKRGKNVTLWRDYTKVERQNMGEILDARYNIAKTFQSMSKDLAMGKFFFDVAQNPQWFQKEAPFTGAVLTASEARSLRTLSKTDWVQVPDTVVSQSAGTKQWGALSGGYVRAEIWRDLNELDKMHNPGMWRKLLTQWKLNKTARSPVVHMNNVVSNMMLMDMADVRVTDLYKGIVSYKNKDEHWRAAQEYGAFEGTFINEEIRKQVLDPILDELTKQGMEANPGAEGTAQSLSRMAYSIWRNAKKFDSAMTQFYQIEDELFRMATYMRRLDLGDAPIDAARMAREQFLDYDIRAPWVNMARRTVLPFIAYTYRAIPVVGQSLIHRPWKLAKYFTLAYMANTLAYILAPGDEDEERRTMRDDQQGYTWVGTPRMLRMPWHDEYGNPVFMDIRRWIPAGDVFDMNQGNSALPIPAPIQFGGPLMLGFEFALNKQAFTGEEIVSRDTDTTSEQIGQTADWLYKSWMPSAAYIPGSYYWEKVWTAESGGRDILGRPYSTPQALLSSIGLKVQPHDVRLGYEFRSRDLASQARQIEADMRRAQSDLNRNIIDKADFNKIRKRAREKMERLAQAQKDLQGQE